MSTPPSNPCKKDCPNRSAKCHSICIDYKKFRSDLDKYNKDLRESKMKNDLQYSFHDWYVKHNKNRR